MTFNGKAGYTLTGPPNGGLVYAASPALLRHYRINPRAVDAAADIRTSRRDVAGYELTDFAGQSGCPAGAGSCTVHRHRPAGLRKGPPGITHPNIQRLSLPTYTSAPNTLITTKAIRSLGLSLVPVGWLIQAPRPLTPAQVIAADHWAATAGLTIETRSEPAPEDLSRLAAWATGVGILLALGVQVMTIGLIRGETGSDLRVLTATGASGTTRRSITGVTAGALAFLGALIGTAGAYLALIAWHRSLHQLAHVPVVDLTIMIAGLPIVAMGASWRLAGRQPPAIARQPLL